MKRSVSVSRAVFHPSTLAVFSGLLGALIGFLLPATFIGDALQGIAGLVGADLQQIDLPQIQLTHANLSRVNFREANLSETTLYRADLSGANLSQARLNGTDLRGVNSRGANLTGADLSDSRMEMEKAGRDAPRVQVGARLYPALRANLSHALLTGPGCEKPISLALIWGAQLQGVDLSGAALTWAGLDEADVRAAKVTEEQLQTVVSAKNVKREP